MSWTYLFIASIFEIGWTYSVKFLSFKKILQINWAQFFNNSTGIITLLPLIGYIVRGLSNIFFFSLAIKKIRTAIALAVWMGMSLTGVSLVDVLVFKQPYSLRQFAFLALVLIGILGLRNSPGSE